MKIIKYIIIIIFPILIFQADIYSCTLWGAIGNSTKDNICLIAKNYDWTPDHNIVLKKIPASNKYYTYFGLYAEHKKNPRFSAGINGKGLVVVTASASSISSKKRKTIKNKKNLLVTILTRFEDIPSLLKSKNIFINSRPLFYMIADKKNIIIIEVTHDGKYSIKSENNGVLSHTNHYVDKNFTNSNLKIGKSSISRYKRINKLVSKNDIKFTLDDFINISNDRNNGPDNSIFRTGSKSKSERTLATWIVALSINTPPVVYIKLSNPGQETKEFKFIINDSFLKKAFIN